MEKIGKNIYLEDAYAGVVLGAIKLDHGLMLVDSPLRTFDQNRWRDQTRLLGNGIDPVNLMLDTHIDRTIGLGGLNGCIIGHETTVAILAKRPAALRPQEIEPGAEAELYDPPPAIHWPLPNMTFSNTMAFYTTEGPVTITHHPGAHPTGCWIRLNAEEVVFVGDSVVAHQPPFLSHSDLDLWLEELSELQSAPLKDYRIISSRNGLVQKKAIEKLTDFLLDIRSMLPDLVVQKHRQEAIADCASKYLRKFDFDKKFQSLYLKRLSHGMAKYLQRHESLENIKE